MATSWRPVAGVRMLVERNAAEVRRHRVATANGSSRVAWRAAEPRVRAGGV